MYKNLGYIVYRTVLEYYSGDPDEDAYGIAKINYTNFICICNISIILMNIYNS